jgi:hypothetical protein
MRRCRNNLGVQQKPPGGIRFANLLTIGPGHLGMFNSQQLRLLQASLLIESAMNFSVDNKVAIFY